jgi:hypothetical protein
MLQCPLDAISLHILVQVKSGMLLSSALLCAQLHCLPLVHFPARLNLHILVFVYKVVFEGRVQVLRVIFD